MKTKRNRLEIIHSILKIIKENKNSIRITKLLRNSNLSFKSLSDYLKELMEREFVNEIIDKKGNKYYSLGDRGFKFLERYISIKKFIEEFDL